jgi:hypothetical protein
MDSSDWSTALRYHAIDTRSDTEFHSFKHCNQALITRFQRAPLTLTATSSPAAVTARCTCASDAAA